MALDKRPVYPILIAILFLNMVLTIQGIRWGLPDRWNVDQKVTEALKMAAERTLISPDYYHPPFYSYLLMLVLAPYILCLKLAHYPLDQVASLAAESWIRVITTFPNFATNLFIAARLLSCFFGMATIIFVFFTARRLYSASAALLASGILAATMGFVGSNHLEISTALIDLIGAMVVYLCVKAIDTHRIGDMFMASLCAGLAIATKLNGVFLAPIPLVTCMMLRREVPYFWRVCLMLILAQVIGFIVGWPTYFMTLSGAMVGYRCYTNFLFSSSVNLPIIINLINYILQLVVIFGIPFSSFIILGLIVAARQITIKGGTRRKLLIIMFFAISYILMNGISSHHQHPYTKYIIFIVPQLAVLGGLGAHEFLRRIPVIQRFLIIVIFFGYSIAYVMAGNSQFVKDDIRYRSTDWIEQNIPKGSTIEHIDQPDWLFSSRIIKDYRIIYLGRDSATYAAKSFYKLNRSGDLNDVAKIIESYCGKLNESSPLSEYFIIFLPEASDLKSSGKAVSEYDKLIRNFLNGKFPYDLVATFRAKNWRNVSSIIKGFSYPHNIFWDPIPDNAYMPSVILIFKRKHLH